MIRTVSSLVFIVCLIGFVVSISKSSDWSGGFFVVGLVALGVFMLAQKFAEWFGIDASPRKSSASLPSEYFVDQNRNILDSGRARGIRSVGDIVEVKGVDLKILEANRDNDGDFIYRV